MIDAAHFCFLVPSWWEVEVTLAAAIFVVVACWFFTYGGAGGNPDGSVLENPGFLGDVVDDKDKVFSSPFVLVNCSVLRVFIFAVLDEIIVFVIDYWSIGRGGAMKFWLVGQKLDLFPFAYPKVLNSEAKYKVSYTPSLSQNVCPVRKR